MSPAYMYIKSNAVVISDTELFLKRKRNMF